MSINVLIAPSGFKESLDAPEVAAAIAAGLAKALPSAAITCAPIADGGEGFTRALVAATGGTLYPVNVLGPVGVPVEAAIGVLGNTGAGPRTAVLEMAAAAGLRLVPTDQRDPLATTTYGVGELVRSALDAGAQRIVLGCGDSGTNDGGMGLAAALGARFLDADGRELQPIGANLHAIATVDCSGLDRRLAATHIEVACNQTNVLCGSRGVARVFGPQKGASPETVERLSAGLAHYASVIERTIGLDVRNVPGGGASGGLGAGLLAWCGATLTARWEVVSRFWDLEGLLDRADLVITAEGCIDHQTPNGKIPAELARRAQHRGIPVVALAGTIGTGAEDTLSAGIAAYTGMLQRPCSLPEAIDDAERLLTDAAEQIGRLMMVGQRVMV